MSEAQSPASRNVRGLITRSGVVLLAIQAGVTAQAETDVAKQLANPVASLISLPMQVNYDENYGACDEGSVWRTNIQPVIPLSLGDDWNLISRTIVPVIDQDDIPLAGLGESGIGDTVQSLFFSPKAPTASGLIWGVGPVINIPTASEQALGLDEWAAGPTAIVLSQQGPWTMGFLANHLETVGATDTELSASFIQPFLNYITPAKTTYYLNTESTYEWDASQWSVPVNVGVNQLLKLGGQLVQVGGGLRYWAESPDGGPEDWGFRFNLIFVFPK